ncbi:MAG: ABC transporter ATP-binding protein [bacterium]
MSSSDVAIRISNLSKRYEIYARPRDRLKQFVIPPLRALAGREPGAYFREFRALQEVSVEVKKGETIGIIGRNGSGKSTLLQMICGTLHPTSGSVQTCGRVAALLELGSGFNPEFSGRENVYMNAAVLGLTQQQIDARFEAIAAFADIGDFIEQPVKTYSSGMVVRLAFSVIAHVDADILVIDEALAVGDAVFTQKCMRFLRDFMEKGTVIFVSHDTGSVVNLCQRVLWLDKGKVVKSGLAKDVVEAYMHFTQQEICGDKVFLRTVGGASPRPPKPEREVQTADSAIDKGMAVTFFSQLDAATGWETGKARILSVNVLNADGMEMPVLYGGEQVMVEITATVNERMDSPLVGWIVKDRLGQILFGEHTYTHVNPPLSVKAGDTIKAVFQFQFPLLQNGDYSMTVSVAEGDPFSHILHHWLHDAVVLRIASDKIRHGLVGIPFKSVTLVNLSRGGL